MQTFAGTERFEILRYLGAGGMGVVFAALDKEQGVSVALKQLHQTDGAALLRLKAEFRSLRDVRHPNLVALHELIEQNGQWFFTMELVEGTDFLGFVRPSDKAAQETTTTLSGTRRPTSPEPTLDQSELASFSARSSSAAEPQPMLDATFDEVRLRSALAQLAEGLHALHEAGKVHRDIKPANLLVDASGRLVISDFGLVTESELGAAKALARTVSGTPAYMAPELLVGVPVEPASDWYSVGVVLYRALVGKLPWRGSPGEMGIQKRLGVVAAPDHAVKGVPGDLNGLCLSLLHPDPALRPGGKDVLARLGVTPGEARRGRPRGAAGSAELFVGRQAELKGLQDAWARSLRGEQLCAIIQGESGVGKTALARAFLESLATAPTPPRILSGRCHDRETVPYKALDGMIDELVRELSGLDAEKVLPLLPPGAAHLVQLFPVLKDLPALQRAAPAPLAGVDAKAQRRALFQLLRGLFERLAQERPLILSVDDLQWSDPDSLSLLREVLRAPAPPLLLVATVRGPVSAPWTPPLALADALGQTVLHTLLAPLPEQDAQALAKGLCEQLGLPGAQVDAIARGAGGHPLFIQELLFQSRAEDAAAVGGDLDEALHRRSERLDGSSRRLLQLVCAAGTPLPNDTLRLASALGPDAYAKAVATLEADRLIRTHGRRRADALEPFHDRIRETVLARLPSPERSSTHERLALALEATRSADPELLGMHWQGAGRPERALEYVQRAAAEADAAFAFERAVRLHKLHLELLPADRREQRLAVYERLATAVSRLGRTSEAANHFLSAAELADTVRARALKRLAAEKMLFAGHFERGVQLLGETLADFELAIPRSRGRAVAAAIAQRARLALRGMRFRPRAADALDPKLAERVDTLATATNALGLTDTLSSASFGALQLRAALELGDSLRLGRALCNEYAISSGMAGGEPPAVKRLIDWAQQIADEQKSAHLAALVVNSRSASLFVRGRLQDSLPLSLSAEQALETARTGYTDELSGARHFTNAALWFMGRWKEHPPRVFAQYRDALEREDFFAALNLSTGTQSSAWLLRGDAQGALERLDAQMVRYPATHFVVAHFYELFARSQIFLFTGAPGRALELLESRWKALQRSFLLRIPMISFMMHEQRARARLSVAAALPSSRRGALLRGARADAKHVARCKVPFAGAAAHALTAAQRELEDQPEAARAGWQAAEEGFTAQGLACYALAARWHRGVVIGGTEGETLRAEVEASLRALEVADPLAALRLLCATTAEHHAQPLR